MDIIILKYKYILFDADDTLLDYAKSEIVALQNLLCKYGFFCSNNIEKVFGNLCDTLWTDFGLDRTTDSYISSHYHELYYEYSVKRFDILVEQFHIAISSRQLSDQYQKELSQCNFLTDGAYNVCRKLSSECQISIVTNGLWLTQKMRFERSRIGRFISYLIVSENAQYAKPNHNFFEYAMRETGICDKSATLIVGDSLSNDIYGGSSFGIDTCWLNKQNDQNKLNIVPTYEISSLYELVSILQ